MLRSIAIAGLLLVAATGAGTAAEPRFQPGPGIAALDAGATGVYQLGTVHFGGAAGEVRALLHHGRVLQVHCRHAGRWLAKRNGSSGGKTVAPTKFDELSTIAGGMNRDIRSAPAETRRGFADAAGLVFFEDAAATTARGTATHRSAAARLEPLPGGAAVDCGAIGCRVMFRYGTSGSERFSVAADAESGLWGFEGYGIVAVWPVWQAD